ncbi:MAG: histidinol-phosphate transaminase [Dehalococcoidia bacterium]|nr:histidinol-phosphate transaminase [Dehalococcoidia bacterium]
MKPYQPIVAPGSLAGDGVGPGGERIKLDGNENVYGCSPRVQEALRNYREYHVYPDPEQRELRRALAVYAGVSPEQVLAGAGSDEIIDLLLRLTLNPGESVIDCPPTFGMYRFGADVCGGKTITVRRTETFDVDIDAVLRAATRETKVIFIASPNNPTGGLTPRGDLLRLLETGALVVADEAYYEFCGETLAGDVARHENLVVLRTFSKWAGLAGLRLGYGIMAPELVQQLMKIKPPYNVNAAAEVAVGESLKDAAYLQGTVAALVGERDRLYAALGGVSWLAPYPSRANFILCRVEGRDAKQVQLGLRRKGIYIRHFATPPLQNYIRISAGKPEHTDAVIAALQGL